LLTHADAASPPRANAVASCTLPRSSAPPPCVEIGCGQGKKKEIGDDRKEKGKRKKIEKMNYLFFINYNL
jgi:hypothetical protein